MKIGELAQQSGITVQALRFYEQAGLPARPPRRQSGYGIYSATDLRRVQLIRQAKKLGFSLDEVKRILRLRERGACPCGQVMIMLEKHLRETDELIQRLKLFRGELDRTLEDWKHSGPEGIPGDVLCALIERTIPHTKPPEAATTPTPKNYGI